jgi:hypothetical protein
MIYLEYSETGRIRIIRTNNHIEDRCLGANEYGELCYFHKLNYNMVKFLQQVKNKLKK